MNPVHHFYLLTSGEYKGYVICLWCSAILKCNLRYHNYLLYPNITEWHMSVLNSTRNCPMTTCHFSTYQLKDYVRHLINVHNTIIIFTCLRCGIGFASRNAIIILLKFWKIVRRASFLGQGVWFFSCFFIEIAYPNFNFCHAYMLNFLHST